MQYRNDRKTGRPLSILGYGCMRFPRSGSSIDQNKTERLVRKAIDGGVNYFDTAYIYPGSERALGKALGSLREKVFIADKLPCFMCHNAADLDKFFSRQLERLKTDRIDYYFCHMLTDAASFERLRSIGLEDWLAHRKAEGQIGQAGFSFHGGRLSFLELLDAYDWDFAMMQYNYADEFNQAGKTGLLKAAEKGLSVMVMEPLLGGKLVNALPKPALDIFQNAKPDSTAAEWGLNWVWNHSEVTLLLSGMSDERMLEENLRLAGLAQANSLSAGELELYQRALELWNGTMKVKCTGCGYCMPCPAGVDIPSCFANYNAVFSRGYTTAIRTHMQTTGMFTGTKRGAHGCTQCGKCEKHCPQGLEIRRELKNAAKKLEPFWIRAVSAATRRVTK